MRVLIVEDDERRMVYFDAWFANDNMDWAPTAEEGIELLKQNDDYDLVCLDHDLAATHYADLEHSATTAEGTGRDVADYLAKAVTENKPFVIVHSWNPHGAAAMRDTLKAAGFWVIQRPFGSIIEVLIKQVRKR